MNDVVAETSGEVKLTRQPRVVAYSKTRNSLGSERELLLRRQRTRIRRNNAK